MINSPGKNDLYLTKETLSKVNNVLNSFFKYIENQYDLEMINPKYYYDFLLVISDAYPILTDKDKWEKIGYDLCKDIKHQLENYGINYDDIGMIGGLGYISFCVNLYSARTNNLQKFSKDLNKFLLEKTIIYTKKLISKKYDTAMFDYDIIRGVAGVLYYLLDFEWSAEEKEQLNILVEYLIGLTKDHDYNGSKVINFHINNNNQFSEDEKLLYPNGNINFGLSHGMLGPLIALAKAHNNGFECPQIKEAIEVIFNLYDKFKVYIEDIPTWPTQLSFEDYISGEFNEDSRPVMSSWCYGNSGIVRGLQKAAKYMNDNNREEIYIKDLINVVNQPINRYNLSSPILCHGYSSVLSARTMAYRDKKDNRYISTIEDDIYSILKFFHINKNRECDIDKVIEEVLDGDKSLLMGAVGIMLSLLSTIYDDTHYCNLLMID